MSSTPTIRSIELIQFSQQMQDMGQEPTIGIPIYKPGSSITMRHNAIRIHTDTGLTGDYIGGSAMDYTAITGFGSVLLGRNAFHRENIFNDLKQAMRQQARMGMSQIDLALWDLAGKHYDAPIFELLGGSQQKLPVYASTYVGDHEPDGLGSPEAYADFAEHCLNMGYRAFKIHGWQDATIEQQIELVAAVGKRVGGKMDLMLDPFCAIKNFGDALKLGRACDEYGYFWYEDPYKDGGVSQHAHRKLRQLLKTPLLQTEHIRGLESHVDFIEAESTDFVRGDPDYDGGITGMMKLAHACEGFGLDMEIHTAGPTRRQIMASIRNTNYYEMTLVHPKLSTFNPPVYGDYTDKLESIDENGFVDVPDGPGIGVEIDWDYIDANLVSRTVIE